MEVLELMRARIAVRGATTRRRQAAGNVALLDGEEAAMDADDVAAGGDAKAAPTTLKLNRQVERARAKRDEHVSWLEDRVEEYLAKTAAATQTREGTAGFLAALDAKAQLDERFGLSMFEKMQLVNHRPSGLVEVHLIVDDCHHRLGADGVAELMEFIDANLAARPAVETAEDDEEEEEEEGEEEEEKGALGHRRQPKRLAKAPPQTGGGGGCRH